MAIRFVSRFCNLNLHEIARNHIWYRVITSNASGRPPSLSNAAVAQLVKEFFCFQDVDVRSVKQLPSYDDRNFYFRGTPESTRASMNSSEGEYLLKLNNPRCTSYSVLQGINGLLNHLHASAFTKCIRPLASRRGEDLLKVSKDKLCEYDGHLNRPHDMHENAIMGAESTMAQHEEFFMRVVTFIPGECLDDVDKHYLTPRLLYDVGHTVGSAAAIMQDSFQNPGLESRILIQWDLSHLLAFRKVLPLPEDDKERVMTRSVLDSFEENVFPKLSNFKKGIIYGDANGLNIIVQKDHDSDYQMAGMIDFGDCTFSYYVFDLGILLTYVMMENLDHKNDMSPIEFVSPILCGYTNALPLSDEELDCLYYIIMARCCQSALNGTYCFKQEPWNGYLLTSPTKSWRLMEFLLNTSKVEVDNLWAKHHHDHVMPAVICIRS